MSHIRVITVWLSNSLRDISINTYVELKMWRDEFFNSNQSGFYNTGIDKLLESWQEIVNNERECTNDIF